MASSQSGLSLTDGFVLDLQILASLDINVDDGMSAQWSLVVPVLQRASTVRHLVNPGCTMFNDLKPHSFFRVHLLRLTNTTHRKLALYLFSEALAHLIWLQALV